MKMINYLLLVNKGRVKLRWVAESWGLSASQASSLNVDELVVKDGLVTLFLMSAE